MIVTSALDEIVNFIAHQNPTQVLEFKASAATKKRVFNLIAKSKNGQIKEKEQEELTQYLLLEHLMRLTKIRAYQVLHS